MHRPPVTYCVPDEKTSPIFSTAFSRGCGGDICDDFTLLPGPVALFGAYRLWPLLQHAIAEGRTWYYGDHGYIRRKGHYRITKNGYQHNGRGLGDMDRLQELGIEVKPMRTEGESILLCPPDPLYCRLWHWDAALWEKNVTLEIKRFTPRPIVVRHRGCPRPLASDLVNTWALVTYHSNAAVEALLAGIPAFCLGPSPARTMGCNTLDRLETPLMPTIDDRRRWAAVLAANQWTLEEIRSGKAWGAIR